MNRVSLSHGWHNASNNYRSKSNRVPIHTQSFSSSRPQTNGHYPYRLAESRQNEPQLSRLTRQFLHHTKHAACRWERTTKSYIDSGRAQSNNVTFSWSEMSSSPSMAMAIAHEWGNVGHGRKKNNGWTPAEDGRQFFFFLKTTTETATTGASCRTSAQRRTENNYAK